MYSENERKKERMKEKKTNMMTIKKESEEKMDGIHFLLETHLDRKLPYFRHVKHCNVTRSTI